MTRFGHTIDVMLPPLFSLALNLFINSLLITAHAKDAEIYLSMALNKTAWCIQDLKTLHHAITNDDFLKQILAPLPYQISAVHPLTETFTNVID